MNDLLSARALGRATLARQWLLARQADTTAREAVHHLVGLQAQQPQDPYIGLWSRLARFNPAELSGLLEDRQVVRIVVMRGTIHLVTADDCLVLRPLAQPILDREMARHRDYGPVVARADLPAVLDFARPFLAVPRTGNQLRAALAERFAGFDGAALAYACRNHLALVQVPPRGLWKRSAQVTVATAESWLGRPLSTTPSIDDVVVRYLAAFGPATTADVASWSGLTGLGEVIDRLRPVLRPFRDEKGRTLVDLPEAPRPDPATLAPVRFLPTYDNVLLGHADRSRFIPAGTRPLPPNTPVDGSVLHDGQLAGLWSIDRSAGDVVLAVHATRALSGRTQASIAAEGRRLVQFLEDGAEPADVRFTAVA